MHRQLTTATGSTADDAHPMGALPGNQALGRVILVLPPSRRDRLALTSAIAAARGRLTEATTSVTHAYRAALAPSEADTVVVGFRGTDRFADTWAGARLLQRLVARTDVTVVAAVSADDIDGAAFARRAGAHRVLVEATDETELPRFEVADDGDVRSGEEPPLEAFEAWFGDRFGEQWRDWMSDAAAAVAVGSDRGAQAEWCQARWHLPSAAAAQRRLRHFRSVAAGEVREEFSLERRVALAILAELGRHAPVLAEPPLARSLVHAARAISERPERFAGLVSRAEVANLLEVASAEEALAGRRNGGPGRPPSGAWRSRREHAIGRVAAGRAPTAAEKLETQRRLAVEIQQTLLVIHDAIDDGFHA